MEVDIMQVMVWLQTIMIAVNTIILLLMTSSIVRAVVRSEKSH